MIVEKIADGVARRDIYSDVASGAKTAATRPGRSRLFDYVKDGDMVVVWKIDLLGGSLLDMLATVDLLRGRGIGVRSISDGIDPATPTGRMMLGLLATLAGYERELTLPNASVPA